MAGRTRRGRKEEDGVNKLFPPATTTTAATQVMPWRKRGEKGEGENGIFHAWGLLGGLAKEVKESFSLLQSIVKEAEVVFFFLRDGFFCGLQHCVIEISLSAISMRASCSHRRQTSAELGEKDLASHVNRKGWDQNPSSGLTSLTSDDRGQQQNKQIAAATKGEALSDPSFMNGSTGLE